MPRGKKKESVEELDAKIDEALAEDVTTPVFETDAAKTEFEVYNSSGGYVRTYSLELHGENAEKLAHQYAGKIGGSVR